MLLWSIIDFSQLTDSEADVLRDKLKKHFIGEKSLKRKESVAVRALLCYMLKNCFGITDFTIDADSNGKPYIINSNIHFNLSHSENYALCVCGTEKVGCDIEKIKNCKERVAKRFFCKNEYDALMNCEDASQFFTRLWVLKESVLKFSGEGITGGLDSYDFSGYHKCDEFSLGDLNFNCFDTDDYSVAICSESGKIKEFKADITDIVTVI